MTDKLKRIQEVFTEEEFEKINEARKGKTWREFILSFAEGQDEEA